MRLEIKEVTWKWKKDWRALRKTLKLEKLKHEQSDTIQELNPEIAKKWCR